MQGKKPFHVARALRTRLEHCVSRRAVLRRGRLIPSNGSCKQTALGLSRRRPSFGKPVLKASGGRGSFEHKHGKGSFAVRTMVPEPRGSPLMQMFMPAISRTLMILFEVATGTVEGAKAAIWRRGALQQKTSYQIPKPSTAMEKPTRLTNADLDHAFHGAIVKNACHNPGA